MEARTVYNTTRQVANYTLLAQVRKHVRNHTEITENIRVSGISITFQYPSTLNNIVLLIKNNSKIIDLEMCNLSLSAGNII
jgi:hypothetical protein